MAQEVLLEGSQARAKIRHPAAVVGLGFITLGIYWIFWWYYINRELRDLGRARDAGGLGDQPFVSCLAFWLGAWLVIPVVWTIVTTSQRVVRGQRMVGVQDELNGWIAGLLWVFTLGIGGVAYTQYQLNKVWHTQPALAPGVAGAVGAGGDADLDRLHKLTELKDNGAITQQEFDAEKARLMPPAQQPPPDLGQPPPPPSS
jgi:hypothetical protein